MALVTIQRSPSPSNDPESEDTVDGVEEAGSSRSPLRQRRSSTALKKLRKFFNTVRFITKLRPCLSESYFTVKGAALILPQNEFSRKTSKKNHGGDMQHHLQTMLHLLRPEDKMKMAVKLENSLSSIDHRYLALVSTIGREDGEEFVILGIDCKDVSAMKDVASCKDIATIGLVLPVLSGIKIRLDGDGGFSVQTHEGQFLFKPVSVQVMWSALQSLDKAVSISDRSMYTSEGLSHTWISYYNSKIDTSDKNRISQWHTMEGVVVNYSTLIASSDDECEDIATLKKNITRTLYEIMMTVDLETATCVSLRNAVEAKLEMNIKPHKAFFDSEVMRILGQMDRASQINDFIYLGSEWNAANAAELKELGIGYILNVTKEIDNFFQGMFKYKNIRLQDVPESDLLKHWDKTYDFIDKARKDNSKVLVHCKMGISRSASTTMAFLMKDNKWCLDEAFNYVKEKRGCVKPNRGFMEQLKTYEGILTASNQRVHFHSLSERERRSRSDQTDAEDEEDFLEKGAFIGMEPSDLPLCKPKGLQSDYMTQFPLETDLETESRSAESMEESLPDVPSPTPETETSSKTGSYDFQTGMMTMVQTLGGNEAADSLVSESSDDEELNQILMPGRSSQSPMPASSSVPFKDDNSWIKPSLDEDLTLVTEPPVLILAPDFTPSTNVDNSKSCLVNIDIYQREDIPWNSGKVQEIRNVLGSESTFSKSAKEGVKNEMEYGNTPEERSRRVEGMQSSELPIIDNKTERQLKRQGPLSVYDTEQLEMTEGIVRKTRLKIEGKDKPENNDDQDDVYKRIQRTSSLKESTEAKTEKAKAKRAERRKTCSPIVSPTSPSPSNQLSASTVGGSDSPRSLSILKGKNLHSSPEHVIKPELYIRGVTLDESTDAEVDNIKVFKWGNDEIPLPAGIVKKCKQEFETMVTFDHSEMEIGTPISEQKDGANMATTAPGYSHIPTTHQTNSSAKTINSASRKVNSESSAPDYNTPHNPVRLKKEKCNFDEEEMDFIHEVGSLLGAKPVADEPEDSTRAVFSVVRDFERKTKPEKRHEKKIVIIDSEGKKLKSSSQKQPVLNAGSLKLDLKERSPPKSNVYSGEEKERSDTSLVHLDVNSPADEKSSPNTSPLTSTQTSPNSQKHQSLDNDQCTIVKLLLDKFEPKEKSPVTENSKTPLLAKSETDKPQEVLETKISPDEKLDELDDSKYILPKYVEVRNKLQSVGRSFTPQKDQESPTGVQRLDTRTKSVSDATPPTESLSDCPTLSDENRKMRRLQSGVQGIPTRLGASPFYNTM